MAFSMRSRSGEGKDAAMNLASGSQREKEAASAEGCELHCAASVARTAAKANAETPGSPYYNANADMMSRWLALRPCRKLDQPKKEACARSAWRLSRWPGAPTPQRHGSPMVLNRFRPEASFLAAIPAAKLLVSLKILASLLSHSNHWFR